jgi:hypothetical protein
MKQTILILLLIFMAIPNPSIGQTLPEIEVMAIKPSFYESLRADHLIKTTKSYRLSGNVKCINENVTFSLNGNSPQLIQKNNYEFQRNNRLSIYLEDTSITLKRSYFPIEKYVYDTTGEQLLEIETHCGFPQNGSKTIKKLTPDGFVYQEVYEHSKSSYQYGNNTEIFDYTLDYIWDNERDTVQLKYVYKTPKSSYQRFENRLYSFVSEKRKKEQPSVRKTKSEKDSLSHTFPFYGFYYDDITYDDNGNIVKWLIVDNSIKDSFNVDQLYEYKYNDKNELVEVSLSTTGMEGKEVFRLSYRYKIDYLAYDYKGNWTLKKVTGNNHAEYLYQREIFYH